jgi:hypothetical protein
MSDRNPKLRANLRWDTLNISAEEGFLLSRIDGLTSAEELTHLTGLPLGQVQQALDRLERSGAIEFVAPPARPATMSRPLVTPDARPAAHNAQHAIDNDADDNDALIRAALDEMSNDDLFGDDDALDGDDTDEGAPVPSILDADHVDADDEYAADDARHDADLEPDSGTTDTPRLSDDAKDADDTNDGDSDDPDGAGTNVGEGAEEVEEVEEGNYRKLFETTLHPLPVEEREALARVAVGAQALALCFDPVPNVIQRLMENSEVGFPHARLIARHHRTPQGLDTLFKRSELVRDQQVQRWLMANPQLNDAQLKRVLAPKILAAVYKWALSRDLPEQNRSKVRVMLRGKWSVADGEERANLVFQTEGRCLQMLTGLQLDSKATTLICQRSINSVMLIQSLCRFTSTPPPILGHLMRQPLVKRQPNLKTMILQHPNCPSDLKRAARQPPR